MGSLGLLSYFWSVYAKLLVKSLNFVTGLRYHPTALIVSIQVILILDLFISCLGISFALCKGTSSVTPGSVGKQLAV